MKKSIHNTMIMATLFVAGIVVGAVGVATAHAGVSVNKILTQIPNLPFLEAYVEVVSPASSAQMFYCAVTDPAQPNVLACTSVGPGAP